jgi:hypothetical protein
VRTPCIGPIVRCAIVRCLSGSRSRIGTEPVDLAAAIAFEAAEARAWTDLTAAVPAEHARKIGLEVDRVAGAVVVRCSGGGFERGLFNRPIGFGVFEPATREALAELLAGFRERSIERFIVPLQPHSRPAELARWLDAAGLSARGAWDRIVRDDQALADDAPAAPDGRLDVAGVDAGSVDEWADFLSEVYAVDAGPWLRALAGRAGWRHFLAREDGAIVAARSSYLAEEGALAFLGVDGPVPGVMTSDYAPDAAICRAIVADGLARRAAGFVADIEAPSPELDTPPYRDFAALGFMRPYARVHYVAA